MKIQYQKPFLLLLLGAVSFLSACSTPPTKHTENTPIKVVSKPIIHKSSFINLRNKTSPFQVSLRSSASPLKIGKYLQLNLRSMIGGYASLYTVSSSGKVASLLENKRVIGGRNFSFPDKSSRADFRLGPPAGIETYVLLVTRRPFQWLAPADKLNNNLGMVSLNMSKAQLIHRLKEAVSRLAMSDWNINSLQLSLIK